MLLACRHCARHVRRHEARCPFCTGASPARGRELGPQPSARLSRAAELAFYVTLGIAAVRCVEQPAPVTARPEPSPRETPDAAINEESIRDATPTGQDRPNMIPIYGEPAGPIVEVIRFDLEDSELDEQDRATLHALAEVLERHPFVVEVQGHADPSERSWKISEQRAQRVKKALIELGVESDRLRVQDYGKTRPLGLERSPHDARVSFQVLGEDGG